MNLSPMIIDSFAGGGGASTGIERALGRSPDVAINHSAAALALHAVNHPETLHLDSNIWDVEPRTVTKGRKVGLLWASPDCFPAGTMILTSEGYRPIEAVGEGDLVLTHLGRWRRVYATMRETKPILAVSVQGLPWVKVSSEHPFFARSMTNVWNNESRNYRRTLSPPEWVKVADLRVGKANMNAAGGDRHFCATPSTFAPLPIPEIGGRGIDVDAKLMWLAGRYVGDGWSRLTDDRAELVIICGKSEADDLEKILDAWPRAGLRSGRNELAWHRRETRTSIQFATGHRGLVEWLRSEFGHGGGEKRFPAWVFGADPVLRSALLDGYRSADGHTLQIKTQTIFETVTISRALALSMKALVESLGFTTTVSEPRKNASVIEGRSVNSKPTYLVRWRETAIRSQVVREQLHTWSRAQSIVDMGEAHEVFNLSVEEDETYVADGLVVHNCKHFSKAKGGAPRDRNVRDLAWVVVKWAEEVRPDVICMENVEEFLTWGPVDNDGQPIKEFSGQTFDDWKRRLRRAGYKLQHRELRGCDYGAPTIRKRFFLVARCDGRPIVWPKPTHGDPKGAEVKRGKLLPWRTAAECIDWSIPCPSIFDTAPEIMAKHGLRAVRPLAGNTLARIARGMKRYVIEAERPFLVNLTHGARCEDLAEPFRTITGAHRGEKALLAPSITRFNGGATGQDLRDPMPTITANSWIKKPGGAAPLGLLAPTLMNVANSKTTGRGPNAWTVEEPFRTITTSSGFGVVAPVLTYAQHGGAVRDMADPMHTITASRKDQNAVIWPILSQMYGSGGGCGDLNRPHPVVTAEGNHSALIAPHIMTMRNAQKPFNGADEPTHTITACGAGLSTVIASIVGCGGRAAQSRPRGADEPMATITAKADACLASAFLAQHNGGPRMGKHAGHDPRDPMSTVAATGSHQMPVAAWFAKYYGTGDGARTDEPLHTITTKDRMGHMQAALQAPPFQPEHESRARAVAEFLRAHDAWAGGEFVTLTIEGQTFVVVDIGMRMLTPRELFNAQGFPRDYAIDGHWIEVAGDWVWKAFPKDVQVSCCGNSVCPDLAAALVGANCQHLMEERIAA